MKHVYKAAIILSVLTLFFSGKKYQKNASMDIVRGLKPAIAEFNRLEQKLVINVAEKLEKNGFPISELTRVHLKKRILTTNDYYTNNEITFFINPGVYRQDEFHWGIETVKIDWEDPSIIRTPDGGIEFEVGRKINLEDLIMNLYGVENTYSYGTPLKDRDIIIKRIHDMLVTSDLERINYFTSKGLPELTKNYLIVITGNNENKNVYEMSIRRIDYDLIDFNCFNELIEQYHLKINVNTCSIEVLDSFDPYLFPNPIPAPEPNPTKPFD